MKNSRSRALPHPLLTPLSNDVMPNIFELSCPPGSVGVDDKYWKISGRIHHQCPQLQTFVDSGVARFGIHVECPRTFYRQWFPQENAEVKISLPATTVRGRVELLAFCIAVKDIEDYQLLGQHADYEGATFKINAGDYLAIAAHHEFDAFLDLDPIRKISSILNIKESEDRTTGAAGIFLNDHRIEVELSQKDFDSYKQLRTDPTVRGLLVNGVVFPAVLQAVNHLCRMSLGEREEAKAELRWCRSLAARLEKEGVSLDSPPEKIFPTIQEILKEPIHRGLDDLFNNLEQATS
jgi:hypothetical protein